MDKETLRNQIYDEVKAEFDLKLKEARREKKLADQELEESSERWRTERRRLNTEIDKLENALTDSKASPRRRAEGDKPAGVDPLEVAKMQAAADERMKKAAREFDGERDRFKAEISRLHTDLAEAITRSNNPLRSTMPIVQEYEGKIKVIENEKAEVEAALARVQAEWQQEKLRMTGEMVKLRRVVGANPGLRSTLAIEDDRIKHLENHVQTLQNAAREWEKERKGLSDHAAQLQRAYMESNAKVESFTASAQTVDNEARMREADRVKAGLEQTFQKAQMEWDSERRRLGAEADHLRRTVKELSERSEKVSTDIVEQLRQQYDQKMQDMIQQKTQLAQELNSASALLDTERARFSSQIAKSNSAPAAEASGGGNLDAEAVSAEMQRVEKKLQEIVRLIDDPSTELSTVIRKNVEKAELDAYLKGILFSLNRAKG